MDTTNETVRRALIRGGEKLFARRAVGDISETEIVEQAGLSDETAVRTLFGEPLDLLRAIVELHQVPIDARRNRLLDDLLRDRHPDTRSLIEVLVYPAADKLADPHGGREYLMICAQMRRDPAMFEMLLTGSSGISRILEFVVPDDAGTTDGSVFFRLQVISTMMTHGLADFAQDGQEDHMGFVETLIDSICAVAAGLQLPPDAEPNGESNFSARRRAALTS